MNSKYIFFFVITLIIGSALIVFLFQDVEVEVVSVPETTTTTAPETTTTTVPETTTTTVPETTTTSTVPETTTTTVPETTTTTVPETTTGDEESVQIVDETEQVANDYEGEFLNFAGFEGENQNKLNEFVESMPQLLQDLLNNKVIYINGCHEYAETLVGRCPYGVWDSSGTNKDGSKGSDWTMSIWISNRAFEADVARDVLIHESSHALSFITRNCNTPSRTSYRSEAQNFFGGEEKFADALVLYFGGSYNHYRESGELTSNESNYIENYLDACTNQ